MRSRFAVIAFLLALFAGLCLAGCSAAGAHTPSQLEQLDDAEFARLERDVVAHVTVGLGIAVDHGLLSEDDLLVLAGLVENVANGQVEPVPGGPLSALLEDSGFTHNEVRAVFLLVEDALVSAGVDFSTAVSPRCAQLLRGVANAIVGVEPSPKEAQG